ncbi:MAG: EamA family transporter [Gammaproteobacteria bacterium]|nr:EamA family transporter [Gammaproteobacteria bacterium]
MFKAQLNVVAGALLFSTGGVAIKLSSLTGWQVSCLRSLVAGLVLLLVFRHIRMVWSWRALVVAVPYAATFTLFALANKLTTAANAIFLQDTAPLYILALGPLLLRERIRATDLGFLVALGAGLGLIFVSGVTPGVTATDPSLGNVLGACSGLTWALTVMGLRWLAVRTDSSPETPIAAVIAGCFLASVAAAGYAFPIERISLGNGLIVLYLGIFQIALAYLLVTEGIRHVPALEVSLLLLIEPVLSPVWAWIILDETPGRLALVGGAVVLIATVMYARGRSESV